MMSEQNENKEEELFCPECGEVLGDTSLPCCEHCSVDLYYCEECGRPYTENYDNCPHCGTDIETPL